MAFYLFPGAMYQRFKETFSNSASHLNNHYQIYDLACRQYLGFGFLFQFIPGTHANKARQQLSNKLGPAIEESTSRLLKKEDSDIILRKFGTYLHLYSYLNFAPLLMLISQVVNGFKLEEIIPLDYFPLESPPSYSRLKNYGLSWLVYNSLNPFILIFRILDLLHSVIYDIADGRSFLPKIFLKGVASLVFGLLKAPLIAAQNLTLLAQALIETLIISPLVHFGNSFKEAYSNPDEKVLFATVKELQDVKELRRTVKGRDDCSYTLMKSMKSLTSRGYIGIEKEQLYNPAAKPEKLVAIQGSAEKINKSAALLSIVNSYSAKQKIAKDEIEAVEEARSVLNVGM